MGYQELGGGGNGKQLLDGYGIFFWGDENILELVIDSDYTTV